MCNHNKYIQRCLSLAKNGYSHVEPNPYVGCVIVHHGDIIGEGWHQKFGEAHAEVNAIRSVKDKKWLKESTLYVNLEPCSHYGKTPPCADLIVSQKIPRVVISMQDPHEKVAGRGVAILKNAGIEVIEGVMEDEARFLNRRFITYHSQNRPYVILKWAQTADGFIDIARNDNSFAISDNWISGPELKVLVHKWRAQEMGILVGKNTVINDNPELTVREWEGRNPIRIVLSHNQLDERKYKVFNNKAETWVLHSGEEYVHNNIHYFHLPQYEDSIKDVLALLYKHKIFSVLVEGGRDTILGFLQSGLWDEARIITGKKCFGKGLSAPYKPYKVLYSSEKYGEDTLDIYLNI